MTDWELYEIVKDHKEAWPEDARFSTNGEGVPHFVMWDSAMPEAELMFEASFHRALLKQTYSVRVEQWRDWHKVIVKHEEFDAPTLIEAYAKALEWLK